MAATHPDLIERALALEANAETTKVKGLGRNWSWKNLLATDEMFDFPAVVDCDCYHAG